MRPLRVCRTCGREKPHAGRGLCYACWERVRAKERGAELLAYRKGWRLRQSEGYVRRELERQRAWRKANPEKMRALNARHKLAAKLRSGGWIPGETLWYESPEMPGFWARCTLVATGHGLLVVRFDSGAEKRTNGRRVRRERPAEAL